MLTHDDESASLGFPQVDVPQVFAHAPAPAPAYAVPPRPPTVEDAPLPTNTQGGGQVAAGLWQKVLEPTREPPAAEQGGEPPAK